MMAQRIAGAQPNTALRNRQPESGGDDGAGRGDRHLVGGQRLAGAELHGDQIGIDAGGQRRRRRPRPWPAAAAGRAARPWRAPPPASGTASAPTARTPAGHCPKCRTRAGRAPWQTAPAARRCRPAHRQSARQAPAAARRVTRQASPARMPTISGLTASRRAKVRSTSQRMQLARRFAAAEQLEQDDRGHHHDRQMHRDEQRQDLEPLLAEYAEHEGNAEQHQVGEGGRTPPTTPACAVTAEHPRGDQMAGGPGDSDGDEIGRPQRPRRRAVEIGTAPWSGTAAAAWPRRPRTRTAHRRSRLQIAG